MNRSIARAVFRYDRFHQLYGRFCWRAAGVACAVVAIIGEKSADFAVQLNPFVPIDRNVSRVRICWRRLALAEIVGYGAAVTAWIERRDYGFAVRSFPDPDVERNACRCFFRRTRAADTCARLPRWRELLCRKT